MPLATLCRLQKGHGWVSTTLWIQQTKMSLNPHCSAVCSQTLLGCALGYTSNLEKASHMKGFRGRAFRSSGLTKVLTSSCKPLERESETLSAMCNCRDLLWPQFAQYGPERALWLASGMPTPNELSDVGSRRASPSAWFSEPPPSLLQCLHDFHLPATACHDVDARREHDNAGKASKLLVSCKRQKGDNTLGHHGFSWCRSSSAGESLCIWFSCCQSHHSPTFTAGISFKSETLFKLIGVTGSPSCLHLRSAEDQTWIRVCRRSEDSEHAGVLVEELCGWDHLLAVHLQAITYFWSVCPWWTETMPNHYIAAALLIRNAALLATPPVHSHEPSRRKVYHWTPQSPCFGLRVRGLTGCCPNNFENLCGL